jgi:hypothetical protein
VYTCHAHLSRIRLTHRFTTWDKNTYLLTLCNIVRLHKLNSLPHCVMTLDYSLNIQTCSSLDCIFQEEHVYIIVMALHFDRTCYIIVMALHFDGTCYIIVIAHCFDTRRMNVLNLIKVASLLLLYMLENYSNSTVEVNDHVTSSVFFL